MKKVLSILLSILMVTTAFQGFTITAFADGVSDTEEYTEIDLDTLSNDSSIKTAVQVKAVDKYEECIIVGTDFDTIYTKGQTVPIRPGESLYFNPWDMSDYFWQDEDLSLSVDVTDFEKAGFTCEYIIDYELGWSGFVVNPGELSVGTSVTVSCFAYKYSDVDDSIEDVADLVNLPKVYSFDMTFKIMDLCDGLHNYEKTYTTATCHSQGYDFYTCTECSHQIYEPTMPLAHKYDAGKVTKAATCKATGVKIYTCIVCGKKKTESIDKKAHTYKNYVTKATLTANGKIVNKCSVCGAVKSTTAVPLVKTVTISATNYNYDGKVKTPTVTVKDSKGKTLRKGTDYDVTYSSGRKNVGKYAVKVTLKGNYAGTKTLYFNINPKGTKIAKLTPKSKSLTIQWNKQTNQTTGYQIQYSTSSKFTNAKTVMVGKNSTTSKTISKLSAKKKYYVRVRTYKTVKINGKNYNLYSPWSSAKSTIVPNYVNSTTVYVTPTGKRFHLSKACAGKNAIKKTYGNISKSYSPCQKCTN